MEPKKIPTELTLHAELRGHVMQFATTWGLFSPKEIDTGTEILLDCIEVPENASVLDLGCGYGPIGLTLGKDAKEVLLVDKDFIAVDYAQKNAALNGLENCKAILSNGFSHVPKNARFDIIVSNLPAKVGKELLQIFLDDAKAHLNPGGKLYVVTIAGLREFIKRHFKETFGNYEKVVQSKGYSVGLAVKQ